MHFNAEHKYIFNALLNPVHALWHIYYGIT